MNCQAEWRLGRTWYRWMGNGARSLSVWFQDKSWQAPIFFLFQKYKGIILINMLSIRFGDITWIWTMRKISKTSNAFFKNRLLVSTFFFSMRIQAFEFPPISSRNSNEEKIGLATSHRMRAMPMAAPVSHNFQAFSSLDWYFYFLILHYGIFILFVCVSKRFYFKFL